MAEETKEVSQLADLTYAHTYTISFVWWIVRPPHDQQTGLMGAVHFSLHVSAVDGIKSAPSVCQPVCVSVGVL